MPPEQEPDEATVQDALKHLERHLEGLARAGVRHLNLPAAEPTIAARAKPRPAPVPDDVEAAHTGPDNPRRTAGPAAPPETDTRPDPGPVGDFGTPPPPSTLATLESLRFQYRDCRACGLCEGRNRLVFGVGTDRPRLMFIGEGPGADEDAQGLPFVGRAGRLLTGLIQAMGLVREDVYITNVVKCRPPGNRNPEPGEVASCRPILQRQIELLDPRLIVTLGNVPLKALNPSAGGITRERGRRFKYQRWPVLPTFHPSYLLRNPAGIGDCWTDLRQALDGAYPPDEHPTDP